MVGPLVRVLRTISRRKMGPLKNPVHNNVISGLRALRQARAPIAGLEHATGCLRLRKAEVRAKPVFLIEYAFLVRAHFHINFHQQYCSKSSRTQASACYRL
ncbi:hypothetical protein PoB_007265900 [Plakobranchus ocellatus]|uniref:Uncharacterized protein n=1 Tax=Plakobranchus ocellatus TaxID=259542 RepID=A0AAV4DQ84_9GAST|nr:hypothetical protein PoB_007265900 [Plakobranchus ocellatus]